MKKSFGYIWRARRILRNPQELTHLVTEGLRLAYARRLLLWKVFEEFLVLILFVKAWAAGEYQESPKKTILWAVAAILYFISPIDLIPDIFPGGYIDDIAVISFVVARIRPSLDAFLAWEKQNKKKA